VAVALVHRRKRRQKVQEKGFCQSSTIWFC
jgi:hypothetical protein